MNRYQHGFFLLTIGVLMIGLVNTSFPRRVSLKHITTLAVLIAASRLVCSSASAADQSEPAYNRTVYEANIFSKCRCLPGVAQETPSYD